MIAKIMPPIQTEIYRNFGVDESSEIPAGRFGSFTDADPENPSVIVVGCLPGDDGGAVYRQKAEAAHIDEHGYRNVSPKNLEKIALIGNGESFNLTVMTKLGTAILNLKHVPEVSS